MNAEFADTNVVLYSLSDDVVKRRRALMILVDRPVLSLQVLNEAANVMRRKLGFAIPATREVMLRWLVESRLHPLAPSTLLSALDVAERYGFSHYDSLNHCGGSGSRLRYAVLRRLAARPGHRPTLDDY